MRLRRKSRPRVVITGAAGLIGSILMRNLDAYDCVGVDVRGGRRVEVADVTDPEQARAAVAGAEIVVDLAAATGGNVGWPEVDDNIAASLTVLSAAREARVPRVVVASSNHVTGLYERDQPYASIVAGAYEGLDPTVVPMLGAASAVRPDSPYAVGKAATEAAARYHAETSDLSVVCLRIGTVTRRGRPLQPRHFATLLTHGDLVRLVDSAIRAPAGLGFGIVYGVSANTWRFWDLAEARELIGYEPRDDAERFR